jgi:decaprenylphospho-beta-D-ribofuranose 2-oxidase
MRSALTARQMALSGWGRYPRLSCAVYRPERARELTQLFALPVSTLVARGAGRAYGDAALNQTGAVVDLQRLNRILSFDPSGLVRCEAGVTFADLIEVFLPRGFFPPASPGTKFVTVGGALAADVHGKSHHREGSFARHVASFKLILPNGELCDCTPADGDLFLATAGGMGLTGIITELELRLRPVSSAYLAVETLPARNLDQALELFDRVDSHQYSMAWIDCLSRGRAMGRAIVMAGDFAPSQALPPAQRDQPWRIAPRARHRLPVDLPGPLLNSVSVRAFNELYYRVQRHGAGNHISDYDTFFYPLDAIEQWNRLYGRRGFVQYQCVWPLAEGRRALIELLDAISRSRRGSFLAVLKRFGPQEGIMSFPMAGYTLALDFPLRRGLLDFLERLDELVVAHGGRVYLAKDARLRPARLRQMYPELPRFRAIRDRVDPNHRLASSLSRRLEIDQA